MYWWWGSHRHGDRIMRKILTQLKKNLKKNSKRYLAYIAYIAFTGCAIFFAPYTKILIGWLLWVDLAIEQVLGGIITGSTLSFHVNFILALVLTPILIVAIPTGVYRVMKHKMPPYLIPSIWVIWLIVTISRLLSQ